MEDYVGILYVDKEALPGLSGGSKNGASLQRAELSPVDGTIRIAWQGGGETSLPWREIQSRSGLNRLPAPRVAFASGDGRLGLLFQSQTPHEGLAFREPHSIIRSLGLLTAAGIKPEPPRG